VFPCLRSLLDPAALLALISRDYRLTGLERVVLLRSLVNDVYRVDTTDRTYVLKVYRSGWRSPDEVAWEVDLIAHLHRAGVAVSPPVARTDGDPIGVIDAPEGPRPAMLSEFTAGSDPPQPFTGPLYRDFGRLIGQLHDAGADFTSGHHRPPADLTHLLDRPLAAILPLLADRPADRAGIVALADTARRRLAELSADDPARGICHGDVSMDNVRLTPDRRLVIHDFDLSGEGWLAGDLCGVRATPWWDDFVAGYTELRPLRPVDLQAIPWLDVVTRISNLAFHLIDKPSWRGTETLSEGYLERDLDALRVAGRALR
jgi:Ser/Thr protein kinase RdoA (MazF antagonist)